MSLGSGLWLGNEGLSSLVALFLSMIPPIDAYVVNIILYF